MTERTFALPEATLEDGQSIWLPHAAPVITVGDGQVYIANTVRGEYSTGRAREFALALLAAADASEVAQ